MLHYLSRRWPKPGVPALAIAAAAVVSAAVFPALITSAAASPAPATAALAKLGPGASSRQVLMLNGDRLLVRSAPGGALVTLLPAPFGHAVLALHLGGARYQIPVDALPYLGHGLDPSLFNLALLERAESAGRLPVRLSFAGPQRSLPGITITSRSGQTATGYLSASSARTFGAALYRQFAVDHATAGYASSPLFAGVSITLAGAPAAVTPRPQFPMHTLTVTGTNEFGHRDNGDVVLVINADNPNTFGDPIETVNFFFHGTAKYSVPAGHYWAITDFVVPRKHGLISQRVVVLPQFTVASNSTRIHLSAHSASSEISVTTPRASTDLTDTWTVVRTSPHGITATVGTSSFGPVFISPTTAKPSIGTIQSFTSAVLLSPRKAKGVPYAYNLDFAGPLGTIPTQQFAVTPGSLATVTERYFVNVRTSGEWFTSGGFLPQLNSIFLNFNPPIRMPGLQTQYMTGGRSIVWASSFFANNGASQSDGIRTLLPGQQLTENWNQYPLHPQPFAQLLTGNFARIFSELPSGFRTRNLLVLSPAPVSDNQVGHFGQSPFSSWFTAQQNGRRIGGGNFEGLVLLKASAKPSVVRFALHVQQFTPFSVLSPATKTVWIMHTSRQPHARIPSSWFCFDANFNFTQRCAALPMLTLSYQVDRLGLDGVTPAGQQDITVSVGHIEEAEQAPITKVSAQVSYDNGQFWHNVTLAKVGNGKYQLSFTPPAGVDVTLRFTASDAAANSIAETILSAYSVGP